MKYDFTSIIDRHNMDAIAVDGLGTSAMSPAKPKEDLTSFQCGWRI